MLIGNKTMHILKTSPLKSAQKGVVLIEALIAVLIFSFAVLGIVGLQAAMIKNTGDAKYRADASNIAQQIIAVMWTDPANMGTYVQSNVDVSTLIPNGFLSVSQPNAALPLYTVTVTWQQPGADLHNFTTIASISGN
jgi:type IV pilus assembly protein PilV